MKVTCLILTMFKSKPLGNDHYENGGWLENFQPYIENFLFLARLNYTFIGSVRTFSEDITYLLQRLKLDDISASHRDKTDTFDVLKLDFVNHFELAQIQIHKIIYDFPSVQHGPHKFNTSVQDKDHTFWAPTSRADTLKSKLKAP